MSKHTTPGSECPVCFELLPIQIKFAIEELERHYLWHKLENLAVARGKDNTK